MSSALRAAARGVRHAPDRVLHGVRRRRAVGRLEQTAPRHLLVTCLGNICRSPYAEHRLGTLLPGHEVRSAGLLEAGRAPPALAVTVARERGIELAEHRSVRLSGELLEWADLVLVMNRAQAVEIGRRCRDRAGAPCVEWLGDFDPRPIVRRALQDPFDQDRQVFEAVYARIDECCTAIAAALEEAPR